MHSRYRLIYMYPFILRFSFSGCYWIWAFWGSSFPRHEPLFFQAVPSLLIDPPAWCRGSWLGCQDLAANSRSSWMSQEPTSPHLSSSRSVAHKAAVLFFHLFLSLARALTSSHDFQPAIVLSFSTVRRQVVLGWPTFLLPIGAQVSAVTQWCSLGILRTCPKNLHLLLFTSILILVHPALSLSSSIDTI